MRALHLLSNHWLISLLIAHGVAILIVNLTPTPKDDEALSNFQKAVVKAYLAVEKLAGIITPLAKK